jgi:hypothetical protein
MNKFGYTIFALAILAFTLILSSSAQAQATRTFVSGVGNDADPCSRTAPCRTYSGALIKTAKDGEISTLDPGGYGAVTINKSVTINGTPGSGYGSILASSSSGVTINITDALDLRKTVRLNWLDINGAPSSSPGLTGIRGLSFLKLHVENTVIDSFRSTSVGFGHGIHVNNSVNNSEVTLRNVVIRNCLNAGVRTETAGANVLKVSTNDIQVSGCGTGIDAANGTRASIFRSNITNNTTGVNLSESASGTVVNMSDSNISLNAGTGINIVGGPRARIARMMIAQNGTSLAPAVSVDSGGNNNIVGNTTNTAPAGIPFTEN